MREFGARLSLQDRMSDTLRRNIRQQQEFTRQVNNTRRSVQNLGNTQARPEVNVNDRATGRMDRIRQALRSLSNERILTKAEVDDKASQKAENIKAKLKGLATNFTPIVKIRDMATQGVAKIKNTLGGFAKKVFTPVIKVKDLATKGINKVRVGFKTVGKLVASPFITIKDKASAGIQKVRGVLKSVGSTIAKPFISIKDGASKVLGSVGGKLKAIGSTVARASVAVKDGASAVLGKIGGVLKTLAKGAVIGLTVAGAGVGKSLLEGADLQQSIGGVETLFKGDASTVIENANKAFQTAGLSANEYMENVTSFSASLLSSLGGDTKKSAQVADMAMVDMADNANKFGTDMESIQNAYQGFAKQNYTMLDNLKLGYGGTKEEMSRLLSDAQKLTGVKYDINNLSDVYNAIHAVQENLGVTGTTAKEASTTFSGSLASMKASFSNLMGQLSVGDGKAVARSMGDLLDSASTFLFGNLVPMVQTIFDNLPTAMATASKKIVPKIKDNMIPLAKSIISGITDGLASLGVDKGLMQGVIDQLNPANLNVGGGFGDIFGTLKDVFSTTMNTILAILPPVISMVQQIAPVVVGIIQTILNGVSQIIPYIQPVIQTITNIITTAMPVIQSIITIVVNAIVALMPTLSSIFQVVGDAISKVLSMLGNHMGLFQTIVSAVVTVVGTVWNALAPVISTAVDLIITVVDGLLTGIEAVFNFLAPYISQIWTSISGFFSSASSTLQTIISTLISVFNGLKTAVSTVFNSVKDTISTVCGAVTGVISGVVDKITGFVDKIGGAISKAKEFAGSVGDKVKGALGFAYGKNRVPYDGYPATLHAGERVLTRVQADQYDEQMGTRGVPNRAMGTGVIARDNTLINAHQGEKLLTKQEVKQQNSRSVTVEKLADQIVVREDADIDKIVNKLVKRLEKVEGNVAFA